MTKKVRKEVQIVLTKTIQKLGKAGTLIVVKSGFARNYLLPKQFGEVATPTTLQMLEVKQKEIEAKEKTYIDSCLKTKMILEQINQFIIQKRVGEDNKIFGKITVKQVLEVINSQLDIKLTDALIEIPDIKEIGTFSVVVFLHPTVEANIKLEILPQ
jgi:large subunit ribosomal protein L9